FPSFPSGRPGVPGMRSLRPATLVAATGPVAGSEQAGKRAACRYDATWRRPAKTPLDRVAADAIVRHPSAYTVERRVLGPLAGAGAAPGHQQPGDWLLSGGKDAFVTEEMGLMRGKTFLGGAGLLVAWLTLAPVAFAQGISPSAGDITGPGATGYAPADPQLPVPLGSTRPEDGGLYTFGRFAYFKQSNILRAQPVAIRGFRASDDSIPITFVHGFAGPVLFSPPPGNVNTAATPFFPGAFPLGTTFVFQAGTNSDDILEVIVPASAPTATSTVTAGTFIGPATPAL